MLGRTLSLSSDRPETFGGYHFLALDTDEINAFAAPGGDIYVSRGLLRCAASEDEVAAILAHEIGHVVGKHGLQAIKKSRLTTALTSAALTAGSLAAPEETAKVSQAFGGFDQGHHQHADQQRLLARAGGAGGRPAVAILARAGYDPAALVRVLQTMSHPHHAGRSRVREDPPRPARPHQGDATAASLDQARAGASGAPAQVPGGALGDLRRCRR